jgi:hypothetical protein
MGSLPFAAAAGDLLAFWLQTGLIEVSEGHLGRLEPQDRSVGVWCRPVWLLHFGPALLSRRGRADSHRNPRRATGRCSSVLLVRRSSLCSLVGGQFGMMVSTPEIVVTG